MGSNAVSGKVKLTIMAHITFLTYTHTQLEEVPFEDLNEDQRRKVERKEDVLEEISRLTKRVRKEDFMYVHKEGESLYLQFLHKLKCICYCPEVMFSKTGHRALSKSFTVCLLDFLSVTHLALVLLWRLSDLPSRYL